MADKSTCLTCKWSSLWFRGKDVGDNYDTFHCEYPMDRLPISMQGEAQDERETVRSDQTGCPCWEAKSVESTKPLE